jgi:hypothetical protein
VCLDSTLVCTQVQRAALANNGLHWIDSNGTQPQGTTSAGCSNSATQAPPFFFSFRGLPLTELA